MIPTISVSVVTVERYDEEIDKFKALLNDSLPTEEYWQVVANLKYLNKARQAALAFFKREEKLPEVYMHINNGGVSIAAGDKYTEGLQEVSPIIEITATHFGHITNSMTIYASRGVYAKLESLFRQAKESTQAERYDDSVEVR